MKGLERVKIGNYAVAKELSNGEWTLYVGRWSGRQSQFGHVTGLEVCRDAGKPIRFASLAQVREYAKHKAL